jgi:hypothetical protein
MVGKQFRKLVAAVATLVVFIVVLLAWVPWDGDTLGQQTKPAQKPPRKPRPNDEPVTMSPDGVQVKIVMGLKDEKGKPWGGDVKVEDGELRSLTIQAGPKATTKDNTFSGSSIKKKNPQKGFTRPTLFMTLGKTSPKTKVTVNTKQGNFEFVLGEVPGGKVKKLMDGQVSVLQEPGAVKITGPYAEDDYPVLARTGEKEIWLLNNEYVTGPELNTERVLAGNFEELVPKGNGDQLRLRLFDGTTWHPSIAVTEPGLEIWRPTMATDGKGNLVIAWSEHKDDNNNWEICYRTYTSGKGKEGTWSKTVQLTNAPGSDYHVVAATDSKGVVWLAWQAWRDGHFQIMLTALAEGHPYSQPKVVSTSKTNNWSPAIAADGRGNVYVAWDAYDGKSYNVHLHQAGAETKTFDIARSDRFEARPNIVCDKQNRVWIAYEEGDEQWGKDFSNNMFKKIGLESNPGKALYLKRTVQVKCLVNGELMQPAGDLQAAFGDAIARNKSLPRLAIDAAGGLWLSVRHAATALGTGEVWTSYALRYNGENWSTPEKVADSENLLDNRPALIAYGDGILEVHSSDDRVRSLTRKQTDLYAVQLAGKGKTLDEPKLVANKPSEAQGIEPVHPNEAADVARMRQYTIDYQGKKLHLFRGEFHRHTEYTSHNDGDGLFEDSFRYGLDAASMDWMGNGDHDNGFGHEYLWWQIQKTTDLFHSAPDFVAALTYERSNKYPNGHRNVMMPVRGIRPLPRGNLMGTEDKGTPDTKILFAYLKHFNGMCASHTSGTGMGTDWRDNDPLVEPVVEIYQGHRHNYEHFGAPRSTTK